MSRRELQLLLPVGLAVLIGLGSVDSAFAQTLAFASRLDVSVGESPTAVAAGDFNRDGKSDLVVADHGSADVSVLLAVGDGTFERGETVVIEDAVPSALAVALVDGDRRPDLIVASDVDSTVIVFLGNGDGTFQERSRTLVGNGPEGLVTADFNGDGFVDVATADTFGDTISIALGNGDGTLQAARSFPAGVGPCGIDAADLNGDGVTDVVVTLWIEGTVLALAGDGAGAIRNRCVGDCNRDGRVTVDELVRGVNLALGAPTAECPTFDRNADGLVTIDELVGAVNSALNGCSLDGFLAGESPAGVAVRDVDGDEMADIVVANEGSEFVSVLKGFGNGTFDTSQDFALGGSTRGVAVADFNLDGIPDIVAADPATDSVFVLPGSGDGTFGRALTWLVHDAPSGGLSCQGIAVGDFNMDGLPDVATANNGSADVSVLLNQSPVSQ